MNIPRDKDHPFDSVQCDNCGGHGCVECGNRGWFTPAAHPKGRDALRAIAEGDGVVLVWISKDGTVKSIVNDRFIDEEFQLRCSDAIVGTLSAYIEMTAKKRGIKS